MTEWSEVGLILLGLYVLECGFLLSVGTLALVQGATGTRIEPASAGGRRDFPRFGPFVPWGRRLLASAWPCTLSPWGIQQGPPTGTTETMTAPAEARTVRFEDMQAIQADASTLSINGSRFARFATSAAARRFGARLEELRAAAPAAREGLVRTWIDSRLDVAAVRRQLADFNALARPLAIVCTMQGVVLGAVIACLLFAPALFLRTWKISLCLWILLLTAQTFFFWRCHRRFRHDYKAERIQALLMNLLAPVSSVFAHVHLSEKVVEEYEPLAVAMVVASGRDLRMLAPVTHGPEPALAPGNAGTAAWFGETVQAWFAATVQARVREVLSQYRDTLAAIEAPPPSRHPDARAYCPRCHDQFVVAAGPCPRCEPVQIVAFSEREAHGSAERRRAHFPGGGGPVDLQLRG